MTKLRTPWIHKNMRDSSVIPSCTAVVVTLHMNIRPHPKPKNKHHQISVIYSGRTRWGGVKTVNKRPENIEKLRTMNGCFICVDQCHNGHRTPNKTSHHMQVVRSHIMCQHVMGNIHYPFLYSHLDSEDTYLLTAWVWIIGLLKEET